MEQKNYEDLTNKMDYNSTEVNIIKEDYCISLPTYATEGSAAADGYACWNPENGPENTIPPYGSVKISLGIRTSLQDGQCVLVLPRSGLSLEGLRILNAPGLIDQDYRGEWKVLIKNDNPFPYTLKLGQRICQLLCLNYMRMNFSIKEKLPESDRGTGGFGSTGK